MSIIWVIESWSMPVLHGEEMDGPCKTIQLSGSSTDMKPQTWIKHMLFKFFGNISFFYLSLESLLELSSLCMHSMGKRIDDRCEIDHTRVAGELGSGSIVKISVLKHDVDVCKHLKNWKSKITEPEKNEHSNLPPATHPPHVLLVCHVLPSFLLSSHILRFDNTIFSCAIKNEYLSIRVLWTTFRTAWWLAMRGG